MTNRIMTGMAVAVATVLTISGCASSDGEVESGGEIRFSTWVGGDSDRDMWLDVIEGFEAANPDISVSFEPLEYNAYWTKINTGFASNSAPDVVGMQFNAGELGAAGQLLPLDSLSSEFAALPTNLLEVGQAQIDGATTQFGLPWRFVGGSLYANTSALANAGIALPADGWTLDEFVEAAKALTNDSMYGFSIPLGGPAAALASTFGAQPLSDDGRTATYNTREMIAFYTWMHDLIYVEGVAPRPADVSAQSDPFISQSIAMTLNGTWMTPGFRGITDFDWDILPNPVGEFEPMNYAGPDMISVTQNSKNQEAAVAFVKYVVFDRAAQSIIGESGSPVIADYLEDTERVASEAAAGPANYSYFVEQASNNGVGWAFVPSFGEIIPAEVDAVLEIMNSPDADIEAILNNLNIRVQALLDGAP